MEDTLQEEDFFNSLQYKTSFIEITKANQIKVGVTTTAIANQCLNATSA